MGWFGILILTAIVLKWVTQLWLEWLNQKSVRAHAAAVPESLRTIIDEPTYARTVEYTLAKTRLRKLFHQYVK